jgi:hypothetical protein
LHRLFRRSLRGATAVIGLPFWANDDKAEAFQGIFVRMEGGTLDTGGVESGIVPEKTLLMMTHKAPGNRFGNRNDERFQQPDFL